MMPESQLEQDLDRLGRLIAPPVSASASERASLVQRVMEQIEPPAPARPRRAAAARWLIWSGVGLAASALLALACLHVLARGPAAPAKRVAVNADPSSPSSSAKTAPASAALPGRLVREIRWETVDQESVEDGDVPVRNLRRQEFERCDYYDAGRHATIQVTVPRSPVILTTMERY